MQDLERRWEFELWENENGFCPVGEFLDDLKRIKKVEYERVIKRLDRFQKYPFATLRQSQTIGKVVNEEFWELRLSVPVEIRFLGLIRENQKPEIFLAVHGFHKKDQKIKKPHLNITRERIKEIL
jgi:phage-related protein